MAKKFTCSYQEKDFVEIEQKKNNQVLISSEESFNHTEIHLNTKQVIEMYKYLGSLIKNLEH